MAYLENLGHIRTINVEARQRTETSDSTNREDFRTKRSFLFQNSPPGQVLVSQVAGKRVHRTLSLLRPVQQRRKFHVDLWFGAHSQRGQSEDSIFRPSSELSFKSSSCLQTSLSVGAGT